MSHKAGLKHTRKQGRPYKHLTCSYDDSADRTFSMAGRIMLEAEALPFADRLKALSVCMPLALKRIPDKVESTSLVLNISDADAQAMLAEARANLLVYKELRQSTGNAQIPTIQAQDVDNPVDNPTGEKL